MRDLYEEIQDYYILNEALSKEPSSPIEDAIYTHDDTKSVRNTNLTTYNSSKINNTSRHPYHKEHNGTIHDVHWTSRKNSDLLNDIEKKNTLHDAMHLHNHFIKHGTKPGDIISNTPSRNGDKSVNRRERIYAKKAGFGSIDKDNPISNSQYGIIKQHPHNHPEEHLRGQNYLHPLEHHEISTHQNNIKSKQKLLDDNTPDKRKEGISKIEISQRNFRMNQFNRGQRSSSGIKSDSAGMLSDPLKSAQRRQNIYKSSIGQDFTP